MLHVKEVLRLWLAGVSKQRIAALAQVDRKTVRRYIALATERGLAPAPGGAIVGVSDEQLAAVLFGPQERPGAPPWRELAALRGAPRGRWFLGRVLGRDSQRRAPRARSLLGVTTQKCRDRPIHIVLRFKSRLSPFGGVLGRASNRLAANRLGTELARRVRLDKTVALFVGW
jgi:hypothetical protein